MAPMVKKRWQVPASTFHGQVRVQLRRPRLPVPGVPLGPGQGAEDPQQHQDAGHQDRRVEAAQEALAGAQEGAQRGNAEQ